MDMDDIKALYLEKPDATKADEARLAAGEPLAYVIGHIPFLGLSIELASKPLIPRPETEWWAEELCTHIGERPLRVLDLCAGSGAIGLSVLKHCPNARVSFGEISPLHCRQIQENIERNNLDASRSEVRVSDLFESFQGEMFDSIATNPPYIPSSRELPESVMRFEPKEALFGGEDGLSLIRAIASEAPEYLKGGELWMECDIENINEAHKLIGGEIRTDQYGRPRLLVAYYP